MKQAELFPGEVPKRLSDAPFIVYDLETTSADWNDARIVTWAVGLLTGEDARMQTRIVNPGVPIPEGAAAVHGFTTEKVQALAQVDAREGARSCASELLTLAMKHPGSPVVAFNARYDFTVLARELERHELPTEGLYQLRVVDPLVLDKRFDRFRKGSRRLAHVARRYGVTLSDWHDAGADAIAAGLTARAVLRAMEATPSFNLDTGDASRLHGAQVGWAAEQAASLEAYFKRSGKDPHAHVERAWPIAPAPRGRDA